MRVLAFDTALGACSAAVFVNGAIVAHRFESQTRGHAETVMGLVQEVCVKAAIDVAQYDRLGVTIGPGTFTGQRVGLSAARAMVLGTPVKLIGITTLQALAAGAAEVEDGQTSCIASVIDARRGEVYVQVFGADLVPLSDPQVLAPKDAADHIKKMTGAKSVKLVGTGAVILKALGVDHFQISSANEQPDAAFVARLAAKAPLPGTHEKPLSPLYLRAPDAKLPSK